MFSDRRHPPATGPTADPAELAEARFLPPRYEPNYAYPLLVLFHGRGGDEQQVVASMPTLSWRNYVALGIRGPEAVVRRGAEVGRGWGPAFARPDRPSALAAAATPPVDDATAFGRRLNGDAPDALDRLEDGVFGAVRRARRAAHVHSERIFLVGVGEGAAVAYRLGLSDPERFAGVVAINGWLPGGFRPLGRLKAARSLKVLVVHGEWNARAPIARTRREVALLRAGGLPVAFQSYPCAHRLTTPMLSDVDTWLINQCNAEL